MRSGQGYRLVLHPDELDADRFERLLGSGRSLLRAGDEAQAAQRLRGALALWRGPPFEEFTYEPFAADEIARLEELRLGALEERIEADLALGRHRDLVPELEVLVREQPLRVGPRPVFGAPTDWEAVETPKNPARDAAFRLSSPIRSPRCRALRT